MEVPERSFLARLPPALQTIPTTRKPPRGSEKSPRTPVDDGTACACVKCATRARRQARTLFLCDGATVCGTLSLGTTSVVDAGFCRETTGRRYRAPLLFFSDCDLSGELMLAGSEGRLCAGRQGPGPHREILASASALEKSLLTGILSLPSFTARWQLPIESHRSD